MELNKKEKQILTLLDYLAVDDYIRPIKKHIDVTEGIINQAINKFLDNDLIMKETIPLGEKEEKIFLHNTLNVTPGMLDDDMRYIKESGINPLKEKDYSLESVTEDGNILYLKASKWWKDEGVVKYESILLKLPRELKDKKVKFSIKGIQSKEGGAYKLFLFSPEGITGNNLGKEDSYISEDDSVETNLKISKRSLKKWTQMNEKEIDEAFEKKSLLWTYKMMLALPTELKVTRDNLLITISRKNLINSYEIKEGSYCLGKSTLIINKRHY